jgi:hypothetical protein
MRTLFDEWQSFYLNKNEDAFKSDIEKAVLGEIKVAAEQAIWLAEDGGSGGKNLNKFDGIIQTLSASTSVNTATTLTDASGVTEDTIDDIISEMINAQDIRVRSKEQVLFMSVSNFYNLLRAYNTTLTSNPMFQKNVQNGELKMQLPNSPNITAVGVEGLEGYNYMVLGQPKNMYKAVTKGKSDYMAEWRKGSGENICDYLLVYFTMGFQVGRPEYITVNFATA